MAILPTESISSKWDNNIQTLVFWMRNRTSFTSLNLTVDFSKKIRKTSILLQKKVLQILFSKKIKMKKKKWNEKLKFEVESDHTRAD